MPEIPSREVKSSLIIGCRSWCKNLSRGPLLCCDIPAMHMHCMAWSIPKGLPHSGSLLAYILGPICIERPAHRRSIVLSGQNFLFIMGEMSAVRHFPLTGPDHLLLFVLMTSSDANQLGSRSCSHLFLFSRLYFYFSFPPHL